MRSSSGAGESAISGAGRGWWIVYSLATQVTSLAELLVEPSRLAVYNRRSSGNLQSHSNAGTGMNLQSLAAQQLDDYDRNQPGTLFANAELRLCTEQAYGLQFEVAAQRVARGERVAGYKIGCISRTMQTQLGLDRPVFGHFWDSELHPSGVPLNAASFDGLAIEGELAVRLADDVPSADWLRQNLDVVQSAFVVIELHNYVFRGTAEQRAAELIANNAIHAGAVLAVEETPLKRMEDLARATLRVIRGSELLGESDGTELAGGPLPGMIHLVEHLQRHDQKLRRGQIVLTGSPLPLWPITFRSLVHAHCESFGNLAGALFVFDEPTE